MDTIAETAGTGESMAQRNQTEIESSSAVMMVIEYVSAKVLIDELLRRGYRGFLIRLPDGANIEFVAGGIAVENVSFDAGQSG